MARAPIKTAETPTANDDSDDGVADAAVKIHKYFFFKEIIERKNTNKKYVERDSDMC